MDAITTFTQQIAQLITQLIFLAGQGLNSLLPGICAICNGRSYGTLCQSCHDDLPQNSGPRCSRCDLPITTPSPLCADCLKTPPSFDRVFSAWLYHPPLDKLVHAFKERRETLWLTPLRQPLIQMAKNLANQERPDLVVATPIHWTRRLFRGYNQSALIAHDLVKALQIPLNKSLKKIKYTQPQKHLNRRQRLRNLSKSFSCRDRFDGLHVALVDDVMTTGATVEALAKLLKTQGAREVSVWVLARTPKQ